LISCKLYTIIEKNIRLNKFCYYENLIDLIFQLYLLFKAKEENK